jgi:hypothetical protein
MYYFLLETLGFGRHPPKIIHDEGGNSIQCAPSKGQDILLLKAEKLTEHRNKIIISINYKVDLSGRQTHS